MVLGSSALPHLTEASPARTFRGEAKVLLLLPAALMRRLPGMLMGSGVTERLCSTAGSFLSPQFSQAKPPTCGTEGQEELEPRRVLPWVYRRFPQCWTPTPPQNICSQTQPENDIQPHFKRQINISLCISHTPTSLSLRALQKRSAWPPCMYFTPKEGPQAAISKLASAQPPNTLHANKVRSIPQASANSTEQGV